MTGTHWDRYWIQGGGGCLPDADRAFGPVLETLWRDFGAQLPPGARVLDLATGNGVVLRMLAAGGRRLDLTGIDSAGTLPKPPPGIALRAGVAMEKLPFRDRQFDALTSQFGIEYGDTAAIAREAVRVLKPGGRFRFVVHHADGPIVAHNRARREAIAWARDESGVLPRARQLARARLGARLPTPASFRVAVEDARARFPGQSAAAEFQAAILQTLDMGASRPPAETLEVLAEIERRAGEEIGRLDALAGAAQDEDGVRTIVGQLYAAGLDPDEATIVIDAGVPLAWRLDGTA
ncbi:methyltransferase domain-containing protein [Sphingosinicella sp. LHD-64]|uniref:methyltransferase domain-containing protein n=1 Tax=Sphingosinicella sp. LHD-64 TaxID=3072139 RepID=UPI00280F36DD|nr:methyltransferase domain-containing protein [Sphingosinicella sp. LHD-64]MDQ8756474.1 methyltransferase domain-containing protein [Sphingosinicella sp. LHD-64]